MRLILIGVLSGIVTGLGMGGGSVLILILTNFLSVEQHIAQAANLIFFIPTAITAILVHFKEGNVDKKIGNKLLYTVIIGSIIGAYLTHLTSADSLKRYFGIFLFTVGILEIVTTIRKLYRKKREERK